MFNYKKIILAVLFAASISFSTSAYAVSLLRDDEIENMLKVMSTPIFDQAGIPPSSVHFVLVDDRNLNAFVANGQNIFINTGLIVNTDNASELIGVIAHETGHIASGHLVRLSSAASGMSFQAVLSSLLGIAVAVGTGSSDAGVAISRLGTDTAYKEMLKHTRTQEGSADQSAVRFLTGAGYPVSGMLSFMKKLEDQELLPESQQSEYMRTHPLTQDRVLAMQYATDKQNGAKLPPVFEEYHKRMKAKTLGYISPDEELTIKGDDFATRYGHAIAYFKKSDFERSIPLIDGLIKEEPKNAYLYELRGQILYDKGDVEGSIDAYKNAVEFQPNSALLKIGYAYSLLASQTDTSSKEKEAIKVLNLATYKETGSSEPYHLLAIAYGRQGDEGMSSLSLAEEATMENKPQLARASILRALALLKPNTPAYFRAKELLDKDGDKGGDMKRGDKK